MTIFLRDSTASQEIPLGYFVDSGDGDAEEGSLTINNTDIKLWKAGATTLASKNSGGATHISNGIYYATLDATDTNTVGSMVIFVHVSGALTVRLECAVLPANVYDSLFAGTDTLQADVTQWLGTAAATPTTAGVPEVDVTYIDGSAVSTTTAQIGANVVQVSGDGPAADNLEADYDGSGYNKSASTVGTVTTLTGHTAQTGDSYARLGAPSGASIAADILSVETDTQDIQSRLPAALVGGRMDSDAVAISGSTTAADNVEANIGNLDASIAGLNNISTAQVNTEVDTALSDIGLDHLVGAAVTGTDITDDSIIAKMVSKSATADWDTYVNTTDSLEAVRDKQTDIETDTQDIQSRLPSALVGGRMDSDAVAISGSTTAADNVEANIGNLDSSISGLNDISTSDVNAQVLDVLATDTFAEPSGVPSATATLKDKIGWLAALARNKMTQTSTTSTLRNDADSGDIATSTVSDNGTTATRGEWT